MWFVLKVFRFNSKATGRVASTKPAVVILSPNITESKAASIAARFPKSLLIAEVRKGMSARKGFFSVLRITSDELKDYDYDLKGCRAILIEGANGMFYPDAERYCADIAHKANLDVARIRLCCSFLSEAGGCNFSCYSAAAVRDYASEVGITQIFPTSKSECLHEDSLCLCIKP